MKKAIVFVHGIFSGPNTFVPFEEELTADSRFKAWELHRFSYPYNDCIASNGIKLADYLQKEFSESDEVTIIGHSMGGLVARAAVIQRAAHMPFVKRIVMLGTPNFGGMTMGQLGVLAQMTVDATKSLFVLFPRQRGILELTRVEDIFDRMCRDLKNALHIEASELIEYITIPGRYYSKSRASYRMKFSGPSLFFGAVNLLTRATALTPLWGVKLDPDHDGIVRESSVRFHDREEARFSEKTAVLNGAYGDPKDLYAHLTHHSCRDLNHVELHTSPDVIRMVSSIILSSNLNSWRNSLQPSDHRNIDQYKL